MPTIRYHEFRPGRWVKLVDGKAVGPATAEEVAAWKRELAGQAEIWEDVLKHAAPAQTTPTAPEPVQTGQPEGPAAPPPAAPPEAEPPASPKAPAPPRILRTVEEIRAAKVAPKVEVAWPAPLSLDEMPPASLSVEEEPEAGRPAVERLAAVREPLFETEVETQPPQPASEAQPSLSAEAAIEPAELAACVDETERPTILAAPAKPAAKRRPKSPERATEPLVKAPTAASTMYLEAKVEELLPEAAAAHDQPEEAGFELGEEPAVEEEEVEAEGPEPELEEEPTAEEEEVEAEGPEPELEEGPATEEEEGEAEGTEPGPGEKPTTQEGETEAEEVAIEEGPQEASEADLEEEASLAEEASPTHVRRSRAAAHTAAARRKTASSSDEVKGPQYLWFETAPADDLIAAVRAGLAKYQERFGQPAGAVLCHAADLPVLEEAALDVDVRQGKGVPAHNFWIGPR